MADHCREIWTRGLHEAQAAGPQIPCSWETLCCWLQAPGKAAAFSVNPPTHYFFSYSFSYVYQLIFYCPCTSLSFRHQFVIA